MGDSVVLLSGGLDSCTVLAKVAKKQQDGIHTIAFDYGQRHRQELDAAANISQHFGVDSFVILKAPVWSGDSVLMLHESDMPHMTYEEMEASSGPSPTYVPFRNGTFLAMAAGYALQHECDTIYIGVHAEDARGWAYPDCTPEFVGAIANAIYVGTYHKVRLEAPLQYMMKADIVRDALDLAAPLYLTHSCYEGQSPACGKCPTCVGRLEAFLANGVVDPIPYAFDKYSGKRQGTVASLELKRLLEEDKDGA